MTQLNASRIETPAQTHRPAIDLTALKTRQQAMWASGDFSVIGTTLQLVGEELCETLDIEAGARVLDVACGNGNATLAAARRGATVTGLDYVPELVRRAGERARAEQLAVELVVGDAERLPFEDGDFEVAVSTYGVMFTPDHEQAARELLRVVRQGGRIGLANWTPEGFIGQLLKTVSKHVAPPAGAPSPVQWGTETHLSGLFRLARSIRTERKMFNFRYQSAEHFVDVFRRFYGPTHKAFGALEAAGQAQLAADITALINRYNTRQTSCVIPAEYLEVVIER